VNPTIDPEACGSCGPATQQLLLQTLQRFGHSSFRPLQEQIISELLLGKNLLAVLPTAAGKSLLYQLPALLLTPTSLVVSPLIALMQHQVEQLQQLGIAALRFDSSKQPYELARDLREFAAGKYRLLFVSPEALSHPQLWACLQQQTLGVVCIDEAHCVAEWGPSFRADYLKLASKLGSLRFHALLALTATLAPADSSGICSAFNIEPCNVYAGNIYKPNIMRRWLWCQSGHQLDLLCEILQQAGSLPAIVYASTRAGCEQLAWQLSQRGLNAKAYHAGMSTATRQLIQQEFYHSDKLVLVATIAFGMGIDKANVRSVLHVDLPGSPQAYVQQSGRAGRDNNPAQSWLLLTEQALQLSGQRLQAKHAQNSKLPALLSRMALSRPQLWLCPYELCRHFDIDESWLEQLVNYLEQQNLLQYAFSTHKYATVQVLQKKYLPKDRLQQWLHENKRFTLESLQAHLGLSHQELLEQLDQQDCDIYKIGFTWRVQVYDSKLDSSNYREVTAAALQYFRRRASLELQQLDDMLALLDGKQCINSALSRHFDVKSQSLFAGCNCTHCTRQHPAILHEQHHALQPYNSLQPSARPFRLQPDAEAKLAPAHLSDEQLLELQRLIKKHSEVLGNRLNLARFLCGSYFARLLTLKLTKHELYGSLGECSWQDIEALAASLCTE